MDRKGKFAVAIAIITLIGWQVYYSKAMEKTRRAQEAAASALAQSQPDSPAPSVPSVPDAAKSAIEPSVPVAPQPAPQASNDPKRTETLHGSGVDWHFTNYGGGVDRVTLLTHKGEGDRPVVLNEFGGIPIGALTESKGGGNPLDAMALDSYSMEMQPDGKSVVFRRVDSRQLEIVKKFTVLGPDSAKLDKPASAFALKLEIQFVNRSGVPVTLPDYVTRLGSGSPLHVKDMPIYTGFNRLKGKGAKFTDVNWFAGGAGFLGMGKSDRSVYRDSATNDDPILWAGVTNQYYATILTPDGTLIREALARRIEIPKADWNTSGRIEAQGTLPFAVDAGVQMPTVTLDPGKAVEQKFTIFAGPREHGILSSLGAGQEQMLDFGMFSIVSRTLLWTMNLLNGMLGSYAAAIIVLTVVIKTLLWPMQNKATASMKRMQELQPKMEALKTKYADDPQRMQQELLGLYKKHGVNPMSGCLPMLVQIPIFFGFYNMLGKAVELRNSSFLWVKDLSQPDTVAVIAGYPLNVLPIIMAATMLWQMRLTPKTGDPVQQRMFMFMPLIFVVFCYNFASALALYWAVQNVFSIVQLTITNRNQRAGVQSTVATPQKPR